MTKTHQSLTACNWIQLMKGQFLGLNGSWRYVADVFTSHHITGQICINRLYRWQVNQEASQSIIEYTHYTCSEFLIDELSVYIFVQSAFCIIFPLWTYCELAYCWIFYTSFCICFGGVKTNQRTILGVEGSSHRVFSPWWLGLIQGFLPEVFWLNWKAEIH